MTRAVDALPISEPRGAASARLLHLSSVVVCAVFPALVLSLLFVEAIGDDAVATDFRVFYDAAEAVLRGQSPYPSLDDATAVIGRSFVYPPLTGGVGAPRPALPFAAAGLLVMALLVAATLVTLRILEVQDWRCYGVVLLWPPVLSAIQTGSVTILLALLAAVVWRYRDRTAPVSLALGASLALKSILWPLAFWLAATRRVASAVLACLVGAALVVGSWAMIGFDGLVDYPDLLRALDDAVGDDSYTTYIVALDLGAPSVVARAAWVAVGVAVLAAVVILGRRGDDRGAFILAIATTLALTPIVWLHYFALLAVVVALAQPRLGLVWFVPLAMFLTPGSGHPSPFETAWTVAVATVTIGLSIRLAVGGLHPKLRPSPTDVSAVEAHP